MHEWPEALSGDEGGPARRPPAARSAGRVPANLSALAGAGLPGWLVERLVELNIMMADGHAAGVTDEVARLIGRQPRTFAQFAAEHRAAFGGQQ